MTPAVSLLYCPACEDPAVVPVELGYIADGGTFGRVDGFACQACGAIREAPGAAFIAHGRVDLGGARASDWFLAALSAAGCDPTPLAP